MLLSQLYKNPEEQKTRFKRLKAGFENFFGDSRDIFYFSAPGRTEIGGNHTDHNHGHVLAAAVDLDIIAAVRRTENNKITLKSHGYEKVDVIELGDLAPRKNEADHSASLIRGICARCRGMGHKIGGFDAYTMSDVLRGSGLSSSAAFEILVVTIISHLFNDGSILPEQAAIISKYAENVYFGKPSGLMDQMASSVGGFTFMDFKDISEPVIEKIELDIEKSGHSLCIVDTGGSHADLTDEYGAIPREMGEVAQFFNKKVLREVDEEEFYEKIPCIRERFGDRAVLRAIHFFDDDKIAVAQAKALKAGDFEEFKNLVTASGISSYTRLQNVFSMKNPNEQGLSLALALSHRILGSAYRVHGGGFAGTIQAFVPNEVLEEYKKSIEKIFGVGSCYVLTVRKIGGTPVSFDG